MTMEEVPDTCVEARICALGFRSNHESDRLSGPSAEYVVELLFAAQAAGDGCRGCATLEFDSQRFGRAAGINGQSKRPRQSDRCCEEDFTGSHLDHASERGNRDPPHPPIASQWGPPSPLGG